MATNNQKNEEKKTVVQTEKITSTDTKKIEKKKTTPKKKSTNTKNKVETTKKQTKKIEDVKKDNTGTKKETPKSSTKTKKSTTTTKEKTNEKSEKKIEDVVEKKEPIKKVTSPTKKEKQEEKLETKSSLETEIKEELKELKTEKKQEIKQEHVENAIADIFTGDYLGRTMVNTPRNIFKREIAKPEEKETKEIPKTMWIILVLAAVSIIFFLFILYHFISFNHHPKKVEPETLETISPSYLFLGDSITELYDLKKHYKEYKVVNSGKSGYTTSDILEHIEDMAYDYNPSKIFLLIGTNDVSKEFDQKEIVSHIKDIINKLREKLPKATLYVESIYPTKFDSTSKIRDINKEVKEFCKENEINYIDLYSILENKDGRIETKYTKDGTHLTEDGYNVVTDKIKTYLPEKKNSK
ncbi:MAG: GDSL-type esterase/lipase family protein [Bacilli bacterium]|nr:GDSL-type esterase/lipase family protein [Bacilli bacterium]